MAKYDCVIGLHIEVLSELRNLVLKQGKIFKIHPVKGRRSNCYELLVDTSVYFAFLDRTDIKPGQTISIFNRTDMLTYKISKNHE